MNSGLSTAPGNNRGGELLSLILKEGRNGQPRRISRRSYGGCQQGRQRVPGIALGYFPGAGPIPANAGVTMRRDIAEKATKARSLDATRRLPGHSIGTN